MMLAAKICSVGCMISLSTLLMVQAVDDVEHDHARRLAAVPYETSWVRGGDLCAAAEKKQVGLGGTDVLSARPAVWLCDCGKSATDQCSESILKQEVVGVAFCPTIGYSSTTCTDANVNAGVSDPTRTRYASASESAKGNNSGTYAMTTNGVTVGTPSAGGFVGTASYLVKSGKINYNKNQFLTRDAAGVESVTEVCVVPGDDATSTSFTSCGTERELLPGGYKFSLFGSTWGAGYSTLAVGNVNQGAQGNVTTATTTTAADAINASITTVTMTTTPESTGGNSYLNFRTSLCGIGMSDLKVNDVASGTGILGTDTQVTSVSFMQTDNSSLTFSFEQDYVFGDTSDCTCEVTAAAHKFGPTRRCSCTPAGKKNVKITASASSTCQDIGEKGLYIDYGFELSDLNAAGKWFVYDPEISTRDGGKNTGKDGASLPSGDGTTSANSALVSEAGRAPAASLLLLAMLYSVATRT